MKKKLELTWHGKTSNNYIEPRILIKNKEKSYTIKNSKNDIDKNILIHGDNLLALKALEQDYQDKIQTIYLDPPFNTGQAFDNYDDFLEHSIWLDLMNKRLEIIHKLLKKTGILFVHIDHEELHYLKIILDQIFGRKNFLGQIAYERSGVSGLGLGGSFLVNTHENILCYAKNKFEVKINDLSMDSDLEFKDMKRYNRILINPGERKKINSFIAPSTKEEVIIYKHENPEITSIPLKDYLKNKDQIDKTYFDNFDKIFRATSVQKENEFQNKILNLCTDGLYSADYLVSRGKRKGQRVTDYYHNKSIVVWLSNTAEKKDNKVSRVLKMSDFWSHKDIPKADLANEGGVDFRRGKKPENLIHRLINMSSEPGDIVLDSFAGSGSTGAVAHKMKRRWIMIEMGEQCETHIIPRLKSVIDGTDINGISKKLNWQGGGGFDYFNLSESLLKKDNFDNLILNKKIDENLIIQAICKIEGYTYLEHREAWWKHGRSTENDFIHVTNKTLTQDDLNKLAKAVGEDSSLLVYCGAFKVEENFKNENLKNLTLKKITSSLFDKFDWDKNDYNLNVEENNAGINSE